MNFRFNILFLLIFCFFTSGVFSQENDFEKALSTAKKENKKVLIDVYTDWCGWCKKMDNDTYKNKEVSELMKNFVFVKLNAEGDKTLNYNGKKYKESELAIHFQVSGYPTTVFLEPNGKIIEFNYDSFKMNNLPGYYKANDYIKILDYIMSDNYKTTDLSKIL